MNKLKKYSLNTFKNIFCKSIEYDGCNADVLYILIDTELEKPYTIFTLDF